MIVLRYFIACVVNMDFIVTIITAVIYLNVNDLVYSEHLIRVLISNFLSNYFNFGNAFTEWCTKLVQYASRWSIKYMYHVYIYTYHWN